MSDTSYQVTNYGLCCECKWHKIDNEAEDWVCTNDQSENFAMWTGYTDTCEEFEER